MKRWIIGSILGIILIIGLTFRIYQLTNIPHGFFADEAAIGYNAYTLLHSGTDEYGKQFPLFFQSFGDYKDPLQIYTTVPFIFLLGLNEFSTRLPSVMWGLLTILGVYFFTKEIRHNAIAGLAAALAAATMPWLIHYNRVGFELNSYACWWIWTLYFFVKSFQRKHFFPLAFIFLGITFYSYQPAKLLVPLLLVGWMLTYHHLLWRHRKTVVVGVVLFIIIALPMLFSFFGSQATARLNMVSVFSQQYSVTKTVSVMIGNYFYQLSPAFFLIGEPTFITRHFTQGLLPLLPVTIPFLAIGLFYVLFTFKKASSQLLFWLLLIYPVAGAVVAEAPFTSRSVIGAPLFAVLIGIGIELAIHAGRHKLGKIAVALVVCLLFEANLLYFTNFYFTKYPLYSSDFWGWQYGAGPIISYFTAHQHQYDDFAMAGDFNAPDIFLKFFAPEGQCSKCKIALPNDIYDSSRKQLFAMTPDDIKSNQSYSYQRIEDIYYPNGKVAFSLVTVTKK